MSERVPRAHGLARLAPVLVPALVLVVLGDSGCSGPEVQPERRLGAEREYRAVERAEWSRIPGAVDERLIPLLESRHPEVRARAALALWRVGEGGAESAPVEQKEEA